MNVTNKTQLPRMSLYILFTGIITALLILCGTCIMHASAARPYQTLRAWYAYETSTQQKQTQFAAKYGNAFVGADGEHEQGNFSSVFTDVLGKELTVKAAYMSFSKSRPVTITQFNITKTFLIGFDEIPASVATDFTCYYNDVECVSVGSGVFSYTFTYSMSTSEPLPEEALFHTSSVRFALTDIEFELPEEPTKEGYTFVGWYLDEALKNPYVGQPIMSDTTLYAKFEINKYTVSFNAAGGNSVDSVTADWNTAVQCPTPTRLGYTFVGWFMADGTQYDGQPVTEDMTLTAHWEIVVCTVTFKVNGEVYKTLQVEFGTTLVKAMDNDKMLKYMNLVNADGEKISKNTPVTEDSEVDVVEMTKEEKFGAFMARNQWLFWSVCALACAGILSTVLASVVAHKRG